MSATLREFAAVNDAAAATTKKLQKQAILAEYFRTLDDDDLRLAIRYAAGRAFAATDERVLNVGWSIVSEVVLGMLRLDPREYYDVVVKSGEIGEALAKLWAARPADESPAVPTRDLTLLDLHNAFEDLASSGSREHKRNILEQLYSACIDPREAAYLSKIIFGDMRTGVQEGVLQAAVAQAFESDGKDVQRAQLLVGDLGAVALLAKHRKLNEAKFTLFHPIQFMLATPQDTTEIAATTMAGRTFFAEDKLDGIRAQVHKSGERVAIYTRTMARADESFPDVVEAMKNLPGDFLLDGEIVPYRDGVVLPFARIQKRLGRKSLTQKIIRDNPAVFIGFDMLYQDGELLMDQPLRERRLRLRELNVLTTNTTDVTTAEEIDRAFCTARECRNEGLVLKDPDSPYSPGRRGQMWLKIKTHLPTFDCVVTAAETGHGKRRNSLSDYTFGVWDRDPTQPGAKLVNIGKAYSGVTDAEIAQLTELFTNITLEQFGRVRLVEPKVVMEIACDQIQKSARHASGYALRFPRIKAIRWDKLPPDADRLSRVIEVYESTANFAKWDNDAPQPETAAEPTLFDLPPG